MQNIPLLSLRGWNEMTAAGGSPGIRGTNRRLSLGRYDHADLILIREPQARVFTRAVLLAVLEPFHQRRSIGFHMQRSKFFAYVFDSPTNLVDAFGLEVGDWWDPPSYDFSHYNPWDTVLDIGNTAEAFKAVSCARVLQQKDSQMRLARRAFG